MNQATIALLVGLLSGAAACARDQAPEQRGESAPSRSRIFHLEELRWPQIDALDRQQTLFILPVGMIEEHGPHLPVGTDTLGLNYLWRSCARSQARPDGKATSQILLLRSCEGIGRARSSGRERMD